MKVYAWMMLVLVAGTARADSPAAEAHRRLQESRALAGLPPETETKETSEEFDVGAHFRGTVKKSFHDLGTGKLAFHQLARDRFQVVLEAHVKHPKSQELLECRVQREYKLDGKNIKKVSEKDWFNDAAVKHKKSFVDCVSLGYAVKWFTAKESQGSVPSLKFNLDQTTYEITYTRGRWLEATLRSGKGLVGRFFLAGLTGGVWSVDKFHIFTKDDVNISFVKKGLKLQ